jgi:glycosyltransferase involved in cell wall biosynthesis
MTIAYLSNSYPEPSEPYVGEQIRELQKHGVEVLACSVRLPRYAQPSHNTIHLFPLELGRSLKAALWTVAHLPLLLEFIARALRGPEPLLCRIRCLAHTWLGVYLAVLLENRRVRHIHVHHGYFSAWIAMVAARLLKARFSVTLHGSDLLLHARYLDTKLKHSQFCFTVSRYNRRYLLAHYPEIDPDKVIVQRMGIDPQLWPNSEEIAPRSKPFTILAVGRLHPVKNHAFLILACRTLKASGISFRCWIAGDGGLREELARLIADLGLGRHVFLLGHVSRQDLPRLYAQADVVVLTSRSEGLPLTLMEAMAMQRIVLAPDMTGIPELVMDGKTGFLYQANSLEHFLGQLNVIMRASGSLDSIRQSARNHVLQRFHGPANLEGFAVNFLSRVHTPATVLQHVPPAPSDELYEDPVLQQVQLSV